MASTKTSIFAILFTFAAALSACDQDNNAPDSGAVGTEESQDEAKVVAEEEVIVLPSPIALSSDARERLYAQFDARGVDRGDINSCGEAGLLASIVGEQGRHFTFCGDGGVLQLIPPGVESGYRFASEDIVARIKEVAPKATEIPDSVMSYNLESQTGGVANPIVAGYDYEPSLISPMQMRNECNDVRSDCRVMEKWADRFDNWPWHSMSWCNNRNRPKTWSRRTWSKQLKIGDSDEVPVTNRRGISFASACGGNSIRFKANFKCPDGWYRKYNKTAGQYERVEFEFSSKTRFTACFPEDLRFDVGEGKFVNGGAYAVAYLTF